MPLTAEEWDKILTLPETCCETHKTRCGYCFNCPILPPAYTLAEANRRVRECKQWCGDARCAPFEIILG